MSYIQSNHGNVKYYCYDYYCYDHFNNKKDSNGTLRTDNFLFHHSIS